MNAWTRLDGDAEFPSRPSAERERERTDALTRLQRRDPARAGAAPPDEEKTSEAGVKKRLMRLESHLKLEAAETEPMDTRLMRLETFIKTTYKSELGDKPETVAEEE